MLGQVSLLFVLFRVYLLSVVAMTAPKGGYLRVISL